MTCGSPSLELAELSRLSRLFAQRMCASRVSTVSYIIEAPYFNMGFYRTIPRLKNKELSNVWEPLEGGQDRQTTWKAEHKRWNNENTTTTVEPR